MLNIFKSNKMENLMHAFTAVLKHTPDNPMAAEWIGIQSRGMKQWISAQIAQNLGVCANICFLFPRQIIDQILTGFNPLSEQYKDQFKEPRQNSGQDQEENLNQDIIFWSVMQLINEHKPENKPEIKLVNKPGSQSENQSENELASINDYIKEDETGKKKYQLSMKIAKVFDNYLVYRPLMLMAWQRQQSYKNLKNSDEKWQAWLWNKIAEKNSQNHIAYKASNFLKQFDINNINKDHLPLRISFFGISSVPAIFLQVFEKISQIIDINFFLLTPSNQFFFDIKSEKQIGKISLEQETSIDPDQFYYEITNPLLSSLGTAGINFQSSLESFDYHEPVEDLFFDPLLESSSMLSYLQSDILNLVHRKLGKENSPVDIEISDTSVSVHACHSPMREAQVLKDLLLNEFEKDSTLAPHDIIVMMPDIEAYAPFIESVFTLEHELPFSISDRKQRSESELFEAFFKIVALRNSRFEQNQVLDLLLSESIARKFNIGIEEIAMIEKMVGDSGILWGKDADHRKTLDLPPFKENTWQFGLQRLFMGMVMPENYDALVKDILPCDSLEGLDLEVLGKLAKFCDTLFSYLETLTGSKPVNKWCKILKFLCTSLLDRNSENEEDLNFLMHTIEQIKEDTKKAMFDENIAFDTVFSVIEQKLDQNISFGKFLTGNITFCNTMPMRSIPFKIVVLMGMDEKSFPKQTFTPGFDLIKKYQEPLDKIERDEERYLFFEILLSARSKFIITYPGISIQDNSMLPCAGVVSELCDTMDQSFIFPENYSYCFFHPLHPFDQKYFLKSFTNSRDFFSFSKDNCNIAEALNRDKFEKHLFLKGSEKIRLHEAISSISLSDMFWFFKNPVQWYMKQGLDIKISDMEEQGMDRENFTMSGLDQYSMGNFLLDQNLKLLELKQSKGDFYPVLKAMGSLPLGEKGKLEYENIKAIAGPVIDAVKNIAFKRQLEVYTGEININSVVISDHLSDIYEDGVYNLSYGKLNGSRLLNTWIRHLFLNITAPDDYPENTIVIGRDPAKKKDLLKYQFLPLKSAGLQYFKDLVQIYLKGGEQVFYFACETSWQLVQLLSKNSFDFDLDVDSDVIFKAMNSSKVKNSWYGGYNQTGEKDNRYISLCLENSDPFESVETLLDSGFAQNSISVYKPMLENMETVKN